MATRIQVRRDTAANWAAAPTTVLASGEIGFESDTLQFKIGDGAAQWQNLEYAGGTTPIIKNTGGTGVTDFNAAALRNNGSAKYLILGAGSVSNGPSGLSTATDGQLLVTVAKYDYTGQTSSGNERFLMTLTTMTTGKTYYRTYDGSRTPGSEWSAWYVVITGDASGNATVPGDLAVNGGDITTTSTGTATVFNTNATTLNVGQAATTVSIGATTGTATIRNATTAIDGAATVGSTLAVTGNTTLTGDLAVNGGDITTSAATATVFDSNATSVDIAGAATTLNIADTPTTNQTINIGTGITASGQTKTINIGTGGDAGSTTNINLGDADGGTVVVNRALTVNGLTTLSGGMSGTIPYSNLASGTVINTRFLILSATSQTASSGTITVTRNFSYTPKSSASTIYIYSGKGVSVSVEAEVGSTSFTNNRSASITFTSNSSPAGTLTINNPSGLALVIPTTNTNATVGAYLHSSWYASHTGSGVGSRTYTITATCSSPVGAPLSVSIGFQTIIILEVI